MAGNAEVVWSTEARSQLRRFYRFVEDQWSTEIAEHFLDLVMEFERTIEKHPFLFSPTHRDPTLRAGKVHKHVQIIYKVAARQIEIITLIDNRSQISGTI